MAVEFHELIDTSAPDEAAKYRGRVDPAHIPTPRIHTYVYICIRMCVDAHHSHCIPGFVRVPRDLTAPLPGDPVNARTHNMRVLVQFVSCRVAEYAWKTNGRLFLSLCVETPRAIAQWLIPFRPYFYLATSEWSPLDSKKSTMTTDVPNRWQHLEGTRGYLRRHVRERIAFFRVSDCWCVDREEMLYLGLQHSREIFVKMLRWYGKTFDNLNLSLRVNFYGRKSRLDFTNNFYLILNNYYQ